MRLPGLSGAPGGAPDPALIQRLRLQKAAAERKIQLLRAQANGGGPLNPNLDVAKGEAYYRRVLWHTEGRLRALQGRPPLAARSGNGDPLGDPADDPDAPKPPPLTPASNAPKAPARDPERLEKRRRFLRWVAQEREASIETDRPSPWRNVDPQKVAAELAALDRELAPRKPPAAHPPAAHPPASSRPSILNPPGVVAPPAKGKVRDVPPSVPPDRAPTANRTPAALPPTRRPVDSDKPVAEKPAGKTRGEDPRVAAMRRALAPPRTPGPADDAPPLVLAPDHPAIAARRLKGLDFDPIVFRTAVLQGRPEIPTHLVDAENVAKANAGLGLFPSEEAVAAQRAARDAPYRTLGVGAASVQIARALGLPRTEEGDLLDPRSRAFARLTAAVRAGGGLSTRRDDLRGRLAESGGGDWLFPILRRDPEIGNATTGGLVGRAVSGALAPVSTLRVVLGDSRRDDELSTAEGYGYGVADLLAGGGFGLVEKGTVGLGKAAAVALRRAGAKGFLKGAARAAVERGVARTIAGHASRSFGRKVLSRAWRMAMENGILQAAPVVGRATDETERNGRPFLQNLRESAGEAERGFVRLFDPRTLYDKDATPHEKILTALNLSMLLGGAAVRGYGGAANRARRGGVDPTYTDLVVRAGRADRERVEAPRVVEEGLGAAKAKTTPRKPRAIKLDLLHDRLYAEPPILVKVPADRTLRKLTEDLFGKSMTAEEVAHLVGAPGGSKVRIYPEQGGLYVGVNHDELRLTMNRRFQKDAEGKTYVNALLFEVRNGPKGTGLVIFNRQVANYIALGIDRIETSAIGTPSSRHWNGYYTWGRFGYNMEFDAGIKSFLRYKGREANDLHELFLQDGGAKFWKREGVYGEMTFDLKEGSMSRRFLDKYKMKRGLNR